MNLFRTNVDTIVNPSAEIIHYINIIVINIQYYETHLAIIQKKDCHNQPIGIVMFHQKLLNDCIKNIELLSNCRATLHKILYRESITQQEHQLLMRIPRLAESAWLVQYPQIERASPTCRM